MKKLLVFTIYLLAFHFCLGISAQEVFSVSSVDVSSDENQSLHGDSLRIVFNRAVTKKNWADPRITSSKAVPSAPAGYLDNTSARNAARNYTIQIVPAPNTRTQAYNGSWYDLGGKVTYDESSASLNAVILTFGGDLFKPGDKVIVTVSDKLVDAQGLKISNQRLVFTAYVS